MVELIEGTNLDDIPNVQCEHCANVFYLEARMFKKISSLVTKSGHKEMAVFEVYICTNCGRELNLAATP